MPETSDVQKVTDIVVAKVPEIVKTIVDTANNPLRSGDGTSEHSHVKNMGLATLIGIPVAGLVAAIGAKMDSGEAICAARDIIVNFTVAYACLAGVWAVCRTGLKIAQVWKGVKPLLLIALLGFALGGCGARPQQIKDADLVKQKALMKYKTNTSLIQDGTTEAYRQQAYALANRLFDEDMATINSHTDKDGKVDAKFAAEMYAKALANREHNHALVDAEVAKIKAAQTKADLDFTHALYLEAKINEFYDQQLSPADAQKWVDEILSVLNGQTMVRIQ